MDTTNRLFIVLCAAAWIVAMSVIIFLTWAAPDRTIARLGDFVEFLGNNNTDAGKLVVTLAAIAAGIVGLLILVIEVAPDDEPRELRIEQAGATMVVPAEALRMRLEEALLMLPDITAARTHVWTRDKGIATSIELTVPPAVNVSSVTEQAVRVVVDAIQMDLGLPVAGVPPVKISFGGSRGPAHPIPESLAAHESPNPAPIAAVQTTDERISSAPPDRAPAPETETPAASPPYAYGNPLPIPPSPPEDPLNQSF